MRRRIRSASVLFLAMAILLCDVAGGADPGPAGTFSWQDNPKPTIYSAYRDYGRFGAFFKKKIAADTSLTLRYRIIVSRGEMPGRRELANRYSAFVNGPKVEVLSR